MHLSTTLQPATYTSPPSLLTQQALPATGALPLETESEETKLVQRLLARDERALRLLHDRYAANLLAVVLRVVRDRDLAQDVLQEGLLKVWLSIGSYDAARGRLFTWMVRVCCNRAIDALRNPRHRFNSSTQPLEDGEVRLASATSTFNPEHIGLRDLLLRLKPQQREVLDLLYFGGCTQVEAAEQLNIPLTTVKTRSRAALATLTRLCI